MMTTSSSGLFQVEKSFYDVRQMNTRIAVKHYITICMILDKFNV